MNNEGTGEGAPMPPFPSEIPSWWHSLQPPLFSSNTMQGGWDMQKPRKRWIENDGLANSIDCFQSQLCNHLLLEALSDP